MTWNTKFLYKTAMVFACLTVSGSAIADETSQEGKLNVGIDLTYPPYDMLVDGKPAGFDPEFVDELAKKMGLRLEIMDTRWAQIIPGLHGKKYDIIASALYVSKERAEVVDFVPYFQTGNSIIMRKGAKEKYVLPHDLCGVAVGMITATVGGKMLSGAESERCQANGKPSVNLKEFPTDAEATQALLSGQIEAQMTDAGVAKNVVERFSEKLELTSTTIIYPAAVGLGLRKNDNELKSAIEEAFSEMKASGFYDSLLQKYGLEPVSPEVLDASLE
jgi:ABC-type amino acid transport substrate-binding protein